MATSPLFPVTGVGPGAGLFSSSASAKTSGPNGMNTKDMFLKLLVTQLKYQDPTQNQDPSQQLNQMASLASMEQMTNLNTNLTGLMTMTNTAQAVSLIGHTVNATLDNGAPISGKVTGVKFESGVPKLEIGGQLISPSNVIEVTG